MFILICLLTGCLAGLLSGLLGIGGGLVVVPSLVFIFHKLGFSNFIVMQLAAGTSLATMIFTSMSVIRAQQRRRAIIWSVTWKLIPGALIGAILGASLAGKISTPVLKSIFAIFICLVALRMLAVLRVQAERRLPNFFGLSGVACFIGTISAMLGVGGGVLTVPFLNYCNVPMRNAAAISVSMTFPIALIGTATVIATAWGNPSVPAWSYGYVYLPAVFPLAIGSVFCAPLGTWLGHTIPVAILKRIFALFLLLVAANMIFYQV